MACNTVWMHCSVLFVNIYMMSFIFVVSSFLCDLLGVDVIRMLLSVVILNVLLVGEVHRIFFLFVLKRFLGKTP